MHEEMLAMLQRVAATPANCDEEGFMVVDCVGGNIDDAYSVGIDDGEVLFARMLLAKYFA